MDDPQEGDRLGRILARVYLALCILALCAMLIHSIPDHRRQAARLRLLRLSARVTSGLARRTGVASMDRELATGEQLYGVPYRLALAALRIGDAYRREAAS